MPRRFHLLSNYFGPVTAADGGEQAELLLMCAALILRGLDGLTMEENIVSAFARLTSLPLKNVRVVRDHLTGTSSGFAFVELHSLKESQDLLQYLEQLPTPLEVDGKALIVNYAKNTFTTAYVHCCSYYLGIPVYSDHAIAAYFAYFAKMCISHIFPHIMAFSKFKLLHIYLCI